MMREEFEKRTGFYPSQSLYEIIEKHYTEFDGDKDAFCKAYKKDADGLATKIQHEADMAAFRAEREHAAELTRRDIEISKLEQQLKKVQEAIDKELEWKPYEMSGNVSQADYEKLADGAEAGKCSHYMTDAEAIAWICDEFDFDPSKITILHEIDEYEINRHHQLRKTGKKIDRRPVYCATDYHYIRFNTSRWYYEVWNDQLRPFYD